LGRRAGKHGYVYEGIATYVFTDALQAKGLVPLYRWFNPFSGDHFYSTNLDSASTQNPKSPWTTVVRGGRLTGPGWRWEGIQAFVFKKQVPGTVPMYRLWNGRDHLYTTNYKESLKVVKFGYRSEGVEFFGVTQGVKPLPALPSPDFIPAKVVTARFPNQLLKPKKKPSGISSSSSSDSITASDTDMMPLKSKSKSKSSSSGSGSSSKWPRPKMLDLSGVLNTDSRGGQYLKKKNAFESFPFIEYGTKKINGIPFKFVDPRIDGVNVLGLRGGYPKSIAFKKTRKVVLPVGRRVDRVHILGLVGGWGFPHSVNGEPVLKVTFLYRGRKTFSESFLLRNGVDIFDFNPFLKKQYPDAPKGGSVAVKGLTSTDVDLRLKTLKTLNKKSVLESVVIESLYSAVAPTIVAVTAEVLPEPPSDRASKKAAQEMTSALMLATKVAPKDTPEVFKKFHLFWKTSKKVLPVYRYIGNGDHMYSSNGEELGVPKKLQLAKGGYTYEGKGFFLRTRMIKGFTPLFRYHNKRLGDHMYTTNVEAGLQIPGTAFNPKKDKYKFEGIIGYCAPSQLPGTSPLHRYWNGRDHFYTLHAGEIGTTEVGKVGKYLYRYEGVQCYAYSKLAVFPEDKKKKKKKAAPTAKPFAGDYMYASRKAFLKRRGVNKRPTYSRTDSAVADGTLVGAVASYKSVKAVHRGKVLLKNAKWQLASKFILAARPKDVLTFTVDNDSGKQALLFASFVINKIEHVTRNAHGWRCAPKVEQGWRTATLTTPSGRCPSSSPRPANSPLAGARTSSRCQSAPSGSVFWTPATWSAATTWATRSTCAWPA